LEPGVRVAIDKARDGRNTTVANGRLVTPIVAGSDIHGYLLSRSSVKVDGVRPVLEQAARVVALDLLRARSVREAEERLRGSLIDDLLSNRPPPANVLIERGREMGIDLTRPHLIALVKPVRQDAELRPEIVAAIQRVIPTAIIIGRSGDILALVPSTERIDDKQLVAVLEKELQERDVFAVVTDECRTPSDYRESVADARRSLEFLEKLNDRRRIETVADLELVSLLFSHTGQEDVRAFVDRTLGPLIEYDRDHGTDLVATAEAYLGKLGNLARTAAICHVHVNTVYYRLDRIKKILGADWNTPRRLPDLQVAFLARRLL
jgi:sugar diacid utilization regulator